MAFKLIESRIRWDNKRKVELGFYDSKSLSWISQDMHNSRLKKSRLKKIEKIYSEIYEVKKFFNAFNKKVHKKISSPQQKAIQC
jgi:hypothetical protein